MLSYCSKATRAGYVSGNCHARHMASIPPFHLAIPVHSVDAGRSSSHWVDYNMFGHQLVVHFAGEDYTGRDVFNPVAALTVDEFHKLADRLKSQGIQFIIEPHLRFEGKPGEQWTMFFKDSSGNNLEFKAMSNPENLFAKYTVTD